MDMAQTFPYTYYACDCYNGSTTAPKRASQIPPESDEQEHTFEPHNPRSNYSLYPLEHLLYCEDCQQIRCPRCVIEETLNWYCPSCLFEVPSSVVKSDGNRCTRNCFNCPVCISPMTVNVLEQSEPRESLSPTPPPERHVLACPYCHWTTVETGVDFEKPTGVFSQLARKGNGGKPILAPRERDKERERRKELVSKKRAEGAVISAADAAELLEQHEAPSRDEAFQNLAAFYKSQIEAQTPSNPFSPHDINFSSPSAYSRIMNLYSSAGSKKQKRAKPTPIREAAYGFEGLAIFDPTSDVTAIDRIRRDGWSITLSPEQKLAQINPNIQFEDELRPIPTLLCTKRSKRCRSCRHILSKPESKITSTRYKIKLLALNHIPRISIRALPSTGAAQSPSYPSLNYNAIRSGIPIHLLLHLSNPLFDPIHVTLATASTTPGKVQSRVTILCPQFDVGANTDVWDDALSSSIAPTSKTSILTSDGQIEAGKVWDKGRNWTSVVIEVVPGFLHPVMNIGSQQPEVELEEDDDLLEIPIFVRLEFEADVVAEERGLGDSRGSKGEREKREEAFWTVLGAGRIVGG